MAMLVLVHFCRNTYSVPFFLLVEDLERNDGSADRPYYMNRSLLKILKEPRMQTKKQ